MKIVILTIKETVEILKQYGMKISEVHLRAGLDCGAYPFGVSIRMQKSPCYEVYQPLLMKWIKERSVETSEDETHYF